MIMYDVNVYLRNLECTLHVDSIGIVTIKIMAGYVAGCIIDMKACYKNDA